jgi:hypothetical protein
MTTAERRLDQTETAETQHTPGPYTARFAPYRGWNYEGGALCDIVSEAGEEVYAGPASFHSIRGKTRAEAEANALLFAASFDLLRALLLNARWQMPDGPCWCENERKKDGANKYHFGPCRAARAAIAKAEAHR